MYTYLLEQAIAAAFKAGEEIMKVYSRDFTVEYKDDETPVTEADKNAGKVIEDFLAASDIPVLGEEGEQFNYQLRKEWKRLWIVDPLDGTREFIKKNGEFTVNIALCEDQKPVIGVIYSPVFKILYYAAKELGSFKISSHDVLTFLNEGRTEVKALMEKAKKLPIKNEKKKYTIVASRSHLSSEVFKYIERLKKAKGEVELISTGSSIKLCLVAEGKADEYPRFGDTMEWDTCAGQCIVEQAGGAILDCETEKPMKYNKQQLLNNWFIAKGPDALITG